MSVAVHLIKAFADSRARNMELAQTWVNVSFRIGALLPESLLSYAVQREGEVDVLLRSIEDEVADLIRSDDQRGGFLHHYKGIISTYWIGGIYEILRLLKSRRLVNDNPAFEDVLTEFELLRMPLEKHEIAKDRRMKEPLQLERFPTLGDGRDTYVYDPASPGRAHIMPMGVSERGSVMWHVIDLRNETSRWLERRALADCLLQVLVST